MKIEAISASGKQLVAAIDKAINDGELKTWEIVKSKEGSEFYTHSPAQWKEKALITKEVKQDKVVFNINHWSKSPEPSAEEKGYYFGRFTEVLLVHFKNYYSKLEIYG